MTAALLGSEQAARFLPPALNAPLAAALTRGAADELRDSITTNHDMLAFYAFLILSGDEMATMLKSVIDEADLPEAIQVIEALERVRDNFKQIVDIAEMLVARAVVAVHLAAEVDLRETEPMEARS